MWWLIQGPAGQHKHGLKRLVRHRVAQVQRAQKFVGNRQLPQGLRDDVMRHMDATRSATSDVDAGEIFPRLSHILQAWRLGRVLATLISCANVLGRLKLSGVHTLLLSSRQVYRGARSATLDAPWPVGI